MKTNRLSFLTTCLAISMVWLHSKPVWATVECLGRTNGGTLVGIYIETSGPRQVFGGGEVRITTADRVHTSGYRFIDQEDVAQFFEAVDQQSNTLIFGLSAYVNQENPVQAKYVGSNYADQDLEDVLDDPLRDVNKMNEAFIWKGHGYQSNEQHSFEDFVCSSW